MMPKKPAATTLPQKKTYLFQVNDVIVSKTLGTGHWLVTSTKMTGGGVAMFYDHYPDAWHVTVQKLDPTELMPKGKAKTFTMDTNCYNDVLEDGIKVGVWKVARAYVEWNAASKRLGAF